MFNLDSNSSRTVHSSSNIKSSDENKECLLTPNSLGALSMSSKLIPSPPNRKSFPPPKTPATSGGILNSTFNSKHLAGTGSRKATSEINQIKTEVEKTKKPVPSTNFKPIISVTNLKLVNDDVTLKTNKSAIVLNEANRAADRQSRDRNLKLRHTHPPTTFPVPPPYKNSISTILKPGNSNIE